MEQPKFIDYDDSEAALQFAADFVRRQLAANGISIEEARRDESLTEKYVLMASKEAIQAGFSMDLDSLDLIEIHYLAVDADLDSPPEPNSGVREPRRPQPSGSAGAIALGAQVDLIKM